MSAPPARHPPPSSSSFGVGGKAARHTGHSIFRSIHCRKQISWNMWSQGVTMNSPVTALTGPMQMAHSGPSAPAALNMCWISLIVVGFWY